MLQIRKSTERGLGDHGWLKSRHTFSFADYYDAKQMGFRSLRVINEDRIAGGTGFGSHGHRDMEIISYVVKGALTHKDSMGTEAVIKPGEVQRMSAGSGVVHSEKNADTSSEAHFFQIWIEPKSKGGAPGYGQKSFEEALKENRLVLAVSKDGRDGSIEIKQDADIYIARLNQDAAIDFKIRENRGVWIQVVKGRLSVGGQEIATGDGAAVDRESAVAIKALELSEIMLFDLA